MAVSNVTNQKTMEEIIRASNKSATERNTGELGKNDFLNLLVTQLRYQDPLNPQDDKEFIAQMAQFTALEQSQNMNKTLSNSQAFSMIGKYVTASTTNETTGKTEVVEGTVSSVKVNDGKTYVVVNNQDILVDQVTNVTESSSQNNSNLSQHTNLIGYSVKGAVYDASTGHIIPATGTVRSLEKGTYEDYAILDGVTLNTLSVTKPDDTVLNDVDSIKSYLESLKTATDKKITITATDPTTGYKVPVKAEFVNYSVDDKGVISTVLNGVYSPVESIYKITK